MTLDVRDLIGAEVGDPDDGVLCMCGTNCTAISQQCPHACTAGSRIDERKITPSDLRRLRQQLRAA